MMKGEDIYRIPDGYFGVLNDRLSSIPDMGGASRRSSVWDRVLPHLALVASFVGIAVIGSLMLRPSNSATPDVMSKEDYVVYLSSKHPYSIYGADVESSSAVTSEDVVNYLIEDGMHSEKLVYLSYNE